GGVFVDGEREGSIRPVDQIVARAAVDPVEEAVATVDLVVALAGADEVVSVACIDHVIACERDDHVVVARTGDYVVAVGTDDRRRLSQAGYRGARGRTRAGRNERQRCGDRRRYQLRPALHHALLGPVPMPRRRFRTYEGAVSRRSAACNDCGGRGLEFGQTRGPAAAIASPASAANWAKLSRNICASSRALRSYACGSRQVERGSSNADSTPWTSMGTSKPNSSSARNCVSATPPDSAACRSARVAVIGIRSPSP